MTEKEPPIIIDIDSEIPVSKRLLEDIRHELVSINGWMAFQPDKYINEDKGHTIINNKEFLVRLDYDELIKKIDKELEE